MDDGGAAARRVPQVLETGVPNLDRVLGGGIPRGSLVMVLGAPGTGKTMLAQQIAFHGAARGRPALYLSAYSEPHDKLLAHSRGLSFFDEELIGGPILLLSLPDLLEVGPTEAEQAILAAAREQRAGLVVLDGFRTMRRYLADDLLVGHFLYSLGTKLAFAGTTTFATTEGEPDAPARFPELTVCDIILGLYRERLGGRHRRVLDVIKARGAPALDGMHPFTITQDGLAVYLRLESIAPAAPLQPAGGRAGSGIAEIDTLLGGGLPVGSSTLAAGSPDVGKTLLGLHFVAEGARQREPGLVVTFRETAAQVRERARVFGMSLVADETAGPVELLALPGYGLEADRVADLLRDNIERRGVCRLVVDSAAELERSVEREDREPEFLAALASYLRSQTVTAYFSLDVPKGAGEELDLTATPLAVLGENVLLLREVEYLGKSHRVISVLQMSSSGYDRTIREYEIVVGRGIRMLGTAPAEDQSVGSAGSSENGEPEAGSASPGK